MRKIIQIYKASFSGLPKQAWLLALVVLVNRSGMMVIFFLTLYLTQNLGFSVTRAGYIMGVWGAGSLFGSYLGGWLSDRWGTYRVQWMSLLWGGIGFIVLGRMQTFQSIAITLFILAVIAEAFRPASLTAFSEICPPATRTRGLVLNRMAANLGVAVGPAVGGVLARMDYAYLFWVDGMTCLAAAAVFIAMFQHGRKFKKIQTPTGTQRMRMLSPWRDSIFMGMMGLMLVMGMVFNQIFSTWPVYLREVHLLFEDQIGLLLAVNAIFIVILEMPLIHRIENKPPILIIAAGTVMLFSGFFILPFGTGYGYVILTVILWTFGEMLVFPLAATFIAGRAADENRGQYMGFFTLTFSLAFVLGPNLGTRIYAAWGPENLWLGSGIVGVIVCLGFVRIHQAVCRKALSIA